jgi:hypothetical protein
MIIESGSTDADQFQSIVYRFEINPRLSGVGKRTFE